MGAGQSKAPSSPPPPAASAAAAVDPAPDAAAPTASSEAKQAKEKKGGGGGCPMENADGTYRIVPGFASLFGRGGHPPVAAAVVDDDDARDDVDGAAAASGPASAVDAAPPSPSGAGGGGGGCPVKRDGAAGSSWNFLRRRRDPAALSVDPANNVPLDLDARDSLPSHAGREGSPLPTDRAASTIPKGGAGATTNATWTYPSPQMFYNALARKGKLGDADASDMESVVAIHNCMNEGTWERILQWEDVLRPSPPTGDGDGDAPPPPGPSLTRFMGRPSDLSPKAFFKHHVLGHPLPFDRHDWTVARTNPDGTTEDVRYVIDYYHDDSAADEGEGTGMPAMDAGIGHGPDSRLRSLLVDVRPAADGPKEVWGRMVTMPLARRGCRSVLECVLFKGRGSGRRSDFDPLPLAPSEGLKAGLAESREVWGNIQGDAAKRKGGAGAQKDEACASDSLSEADGDAAAGAVATTEPEEEQAAISATEAAELASSFSKILSSCGEAKEALRTCASEEECRRAFAGMTVCAGQFLCPLQHRGLVGTLEGHGDGAGGEGSEARVDAAFEVLGECVVRRDARANEARRRFPEAFGGAPAEGG